MKNMFDSAPCAYYLPEPEAACLSKLADILCDPTCSQSRPQDRQNQICPMVGHSCHPPLRAQALQSDFLRQRNLDERGRFVDKRKWTFGKKTPQLRKAIQTDWGGVVTRSIQYESGRLCLPFRWDVNATQLISQIKECCCITIPLSAVRYGGQRMGAVEYL